MSKQPPSLPLQETRQDAHVTATSREPAPASASERVSVGIMRDLEQQRLVPGQRLIETEIAQRFGVGRNAAREAIQRLAATGIVDLSRNRSPSIRRLAIEETLDVLDVAEAMTALLGRLAAQNFDGGVHLSRMQTVLSELSDCEATRDPDAFSRMRRHFYRTLLDITRNRELDRHFSAMNMHIVYLQYRSALLQDARFKDYRAICQAVIDRDARLAEAAARQHVRRVRQLIQELSAAGHEELIERRIGQ
jgi:DNA-binding GntR family transcriptional regulator